MYRITDRLATHGLGETEYPQDFMNNRTGELETINDETWTILDARFMKDEPQDREVYKAAILLAGQMLNTYHRKLLICCGAGQSRSNAIALGYLVAWEKMNFYDAWELVREKVPIANIEPCHISALKGIFNVTIP